MYRVVVVDDEVLIRMYIREILQNNGYEVVGEAEDGLDAIRICREEKPDFVIMDISMPFLGGFEASKVIKDENLAGFTMILTAYRDKEIAKRAVDIDVMGYIVKPVDEDVLIPAIEIAINKYNQIKNMEKQFDKTKGALDDRKFVDRAKGLLMDKRKVSEKEAYAYLRKMAMDKGLPLVEVAKLLLKAYGEE